MTTNTQCCEGMEERCDTCAKYIKWLKGRKRTCTCGSVMRIANAEAWPREWPYFDCPTKNSKHDRKQAL